MAPKTKLFVGHLPDGVKSEDLQTLFEKYGKVTECDVINKYGFVHMSTDEEAEEALKNLNNFNFKGSNLSVERSTSKFHQEPGAPGRAKGPKPFFGQRNGFDKRGGFYNGNYNDFRGGMGRESFFDRMPFFRDRPRPYPMPFERRGPPMPPPREEMFSRRPLPPGEDPFTRRMPPLGVRDDLFDRRPMRERPMPPVPSDYLYSRRSPTSVGAGSYWGAGAGYGAREDRNGIDYSTERMYPYSGGSYQSNF